MNESGKKDFGVCLQRLIGGESLSEDEAYAVFSQVLRDEQTEMHQGAFLAALAAKGETVEEIVGVWRAIREIDTVQVSAALPAPLFENSGTGMDPIKTFNVSSAAAIVAAACGVRMARHGARAITSRCGTVDIMEAVGVDVECDVPTVEKSICEVGIGLFNGNSAKVHPTALGRILSRIRFGSVLNIAASLAHPCRPSLGLRGVHSVTMLDKTARAMMAVGYERGMVVCGSDGRSGKAVDEVSITGRSVAIRFGSEGEDRIYIEPEDVGLRRAAVEAVAATGDLRREAQRFVRVLSGRGNAACLDFTCLNAGAVLLVAEAAEDLADGVRRSREAIESGRALAKLREWVATQAAPGGAGTARLEGLLREA